MAATRKTIDPHPPRQTHDGAERQLLDSTPVGILVTRIKDGTILYANKTGGELLHIQDIATIIGTPVPNFYWHPEERKIVLERFQKDGRLSAYELRLRRTDDSMFWASVSLRPFEFENEKCILTAITDISEQKQAETSARESEALFRSLFENSADAVLLLENGIFTDCNQATVEMMHAENKAEFLSLHPSLLSPEFQPDGRPSGEKADEMIQISIEKGSNRFEWTHRRVDGTDIPVEVLLTPMTMGDRQVIYTVWRDVTERKRLEQEAKETFERRGRQVEISTQVAQEIASAANLDELYQRVVAQVKEQFGYYHTQILRYDPARDAVVLVVGYGETGEKMLASGHQLPMGTGLIGAAAATGQTILRPRLQNDPEWQPNPLLPETKGEIAVPIKLRDQVLGVLDVQSDQENALGSDDQLLLEGLCGQIAIAIEQTRLQGEMNERLEEINRLYRAVSQEGWETYRKTGKLPDGFVFEQAEVKPLKETSLADELFASIPLVVPGGEILGTLAISEDPQTPFATDDRAFLQQVSEQVALALDSARLFEQTQLALSEVKQGQARLHTLIENAPEAIAVINMSTGKFIEPNENALKLYGLSREEFVKVGPAEMSPPSQPDGRPSEEAALEKISEALEGGTPVFEWIHRNGQGQDFPCEVRLVRLPGDQPQIRFSVTDITERKKAQETIARRAAELATVAQVSTTTSTTLDPEQLLQSVVDLTKEYFDIYHVHIYLADETLNSLVLSAGAGDIGRQMVAQQHTIAIDAKKSLVARASQERQAVIVNDVRRDPDFLPNPLLPDTRAEMAVPMIAGDNTLGVFDVQSDKVDYFTEEDANIYTTLAAQVAVALQNARLYAEQAAIVAQLRELDRLKSSFLANMSHELRTPLNSILGFSDVMLDGIDGPLTQNMIEDLELIQKNGRHLLHLINDVLDMAKIEAGKMNLMLEKFNMYEILDEVTSITSPLASEKSLSLFIEPDSDQQVELTADKTRLRQVLLNLINNSIKFTEQGKISLRLERINELVLITVKDTGIGIPPSQVETIFQEFTQVDISSTRKVGGTGLGLPISRRLIEMHGGRLWAESTGVDGEGATFYVELPLEAKVPESAEAQES